MSRRKQLTWDRAIERYENHLRARRIAARTLDARLRDLRHLRQHTGGRTPRGVTLEQLREFQLGLMTGKNSRSGKPLCAGRVANATSNWRSFFSFLHCEELIKTNPTDRLERPKVPQRQPGRVLTVEEVRALIQAASQTPLGLRDQALVEVLYATGIRRAEACGIDLGDLDHGQRLLTIRHGKGDKSRVIPVTRSCYHALDAYLGEGRPALVTSHPDSFGALFLTKAGRRLHAVAVLRALRRLTNAAGLQEQVTPHDLRRTFATHLLRNGATLRHIQILLGHASLATTSVYLRLDTSELRQEILLRHPRERFE